MFHVSKFTRESNPGLCTTSILAKSIPLRIGEFQPILRPNRFFDWSFFIRTHGKTLQQRGADLESVESVFSIDMHKCIAIDLLE
jgi:hypothetical protein